MNSSLSSTDLSHVFADSVDAIEKIVMIFLTENFASNSDRSKSKL